MKRAPVEPFDWPGFFKTFRYQPVPVWIICALLLKPAAKATPAVLRAACTGPTREGIVNFAFVVYGVVVPAAAATLVYLFFGRRRMSRPHRLMGDLCLALVLLISAANGLSLGRQARANWAVLGPGLRSLRAACWK
ncbi:MAG TPA: hypothetical protein VN915_11005 [Elusimicrobiota bacterium]|nr:hypothetical protein [Elusimicrobiota bacterium]